MCHVSAVNRRGRLQPRLKSQSATTRPTFAGLSVALPPDPPQIARSVCNDTCSGGTRHPATIQIFPCTMGQSRGLLYRVYRIRSTLLISEIKISIILILRHLRLFGCSAPFREFEWACELVSGRLPGAKPPGSCCRLFNLALPARWGS